MIMYACMSCELSYWGKPAPPGTEEENDYLSSKRWFLNRVSSLITCMHVNVRNEYRMLIERGERSYFVFKIQHDRRKRPGSDFRVSRAKRTSTVLNTCNEHYFCTLVGSGLWNRAVITDLLDDSLSMNTRLPAQFMVQRRFFQDDDLYDFMIMKIHAFGMYRNEIV